MNEMLMSSEQREKAKEEREAKLSVVKGNATTLLKDHIFRDWAYAEMRRVGFFGEGRELSQYEQGVRGGIVRLFSKLIELSDIGDEFVAGFINYLKEGKQ